MEDLHKRLFDKMNICQKILYDWMGFGEEITEPFPSKYIIALAPHTSNWDFIIGILYCKANGFHCNFLIKKECFFWPIGKLMHRLGGIPVYRNKNTGLTDIVAAEARKRDSFRLCITPEGTRKPAKEWKKGFYYIALKANIPILLFGLDYEKKQIRCTRTIIPTGDFEQDLKIIKQYYKEFKGKHPKKFVV